MKTKTEYQKKNLRLFILAKDRITSESFSKKFLDRLLNTTNMFLETYLEGL